MIKQCKKCGSKNLYLEPRIKGQDAMTADMVALKCRDCGVWLKWCPKDERKYYLNKQPKEDIKWQKLKEIIKNLYVKAEPGGLEHCVTAYIYKKMHKLEAEDVED